MNNCEYLPWSGRRYQISPIGEIKDSSGNSIETFLKDGHLHVRLCWVLGTRDYNLASIVLITFGKIKIPEYLFDEIVPLYKDSSITNLSPVNLLYKFKSGKLEVQDFPGFYYIPFFSDYAINSAGDLINITTGKFKVWSITKPNEIKNSTGGYRYSRVVNEEGYSKCLFLHRAMCLVFLDYDSSIDGLVVNHKDGDPSNNELSNLELVTHLRNNIHAVEVGLRGDNKPVLCKNLRTGEIMQFPSIGACGRHFNEPRAGFIHHRIFKSPTKVFSDMLVFKLDDDKPWPDFDMTKIAISGINDNYVGRNVFTGDLVIFNSCSDNRFGVKAATILNHVKNKIKIPVNGWNFKYLDDKEPWPIHSEKHLKIYSKYRIYPPDGVQCIDIESNEETFFESVSICCQKFTFQKNVLYSLMKSKKPYKGKYVFELFDIRKNLGHPAE